MFTFRHQLKFLGATDQCKVANMVLESDVSTLNPGGMIYQNKLQPTPSLQHAIHQNEEAIYCPCEICNNNVMYLIKDRDLVHEHLI
jgi:hypothetical protein